MSGSKQEAWNRFRSTPWPFAFLLFGLIAAVFYPVLGFEFLNFDDPALLTQNSFFLPLTWANFLNFWNPLLLWRGELLDYSPIRDWSYALDLVIWGWNSKGFHLTQVLLHSINSILVFLLFSVGFSRSLAFLGACIFAFHPLVVEPVAWITGRKDLLALSFFLSSLLLFQGKRESWAFLSGVLSILSKYVGIVLAPILFLRDLFERKKPRLLVLVLLLFTILFSLFVFFANRQDGGLVQESSRASTLKGVFWALSFQCSKLVWPLDLSARYAQPGGLTWSSTGVLAGIFLFLLSSGFGVWTFLKRNKSFFAWLLFVFPWVPNILQILSGHPVWVADRYLYFVLPGFIYFLLLSFESIFRRLPITFRGLFFSLPLLLAFLSADRLPVWKDSRSLWEDTVKKSPSLYYAWANMGLVHLDAGEIGPAQEKIEKALALYPAWVRGRLHLAEVYSARGNLVQARENLLLFESKATRKDKEALILSRAILYARLGDPENAGPLFQDRLSKAPEDPLAWSNWGTFLAIHGREEEAAKAWQKATTFNPNYVDAHMNLTRYYKKFGQCGLMRKELRHLVRLGVFNERALKSWVEACGGN